MARELDKTLADTLAKYHPAPKSAVWDCHGTWVVRHKDVELMAARAGIKFNPPTIIEASGERKVVAMIVTASLGDVTDWATGEAAPGNNKNAYPFAMSEKRARDRVAIKLLGLHGLYSEDEAEEFKDRPQESPKPVITSGKSEGEAYLAEALATVETFTSESALVAWSKGEVPHVQRLLTTEQAGKLSAAIRSKRADLRNVEPLKPKAVA